MTVPASLEKKVVLACDRARAFELFTREISAWWPPDRRHTGDAQSALFLSPHRFFERARDGREVDLGKVRVWEPPRRIVLDFYVGTDAQHPTDVEIDFSDAAGGTLVRVLHRPTEASAELWGLRVARFESSWSLVLAALAEASAPTA